MDYDATRRRMVENQIRTNRVTDPLVIDSMSEVPREVFVPKELKGIAYVDEDIPVGRGRFIMEPLVTALLLQTAEIRPDDVVLEIGCTTGYTSVLIARMASAVVAVEEDKELAAYAAQAIRGFGVETVTVAEGRLAEGFPAQSPYDVIIFGGAITEVPEAITQQLAEGGRIVAVIASGPGLGKGTLFSRTGGIISRREVFDAATSMLPGFGRKPMFNF